jgi:hypothetical protein
LRAVIAVAGDLLIQLCKRAQQGTAVACTLVAIDAFIQDVSSKWPQGALGRRRVPSLFGATGLKNTANGVTAQQKAGYCRFKLGKIDSRPRDLLRPF